MKFFVIIKRWDDEKGRIIKEIAGSFDRYTNARIFRDAYAAEFSATPFIVSQDGLMSLLND